MPRTYMGGAIPIREMIVRAVDLLVDMRLKGERHVIVTLSALWASMRPANISSRRWCELAFVGRCCRIGVEVGQSHYANLSD